MKKEEIHWEDWQRILLGNAPLEFMLEVLIRTAIIYFFLLVTLRLMGKRMGGQLTIAELAVMLTLGAIVSVPMQAPDKGLLQGLLVLICALIFQRGLTYFAVKHKKIESLTEGTASMVVKDGVLLVDQLSALKISKEQLLAVLRNQEVYNLGEVQRLYLEACGIFSVFRYASPKPGLLITPDADEGTYAAFDVDETMQSCENCGNTIAANTSNSTCDNCGSTSWTNAIKLKSDESI